MINEMQLNILMSNIILSISTGLQQVMDKTIVEYVWHDDDYNFRSKTKICDYEVNTLDDVEYWDFDGTSTGQIKISSNSMTKTSEVTLCPVKLYHDPFRGGKHKIVLCDTYIDEIPTKSNKRYEAEKVLSKNSKRINHGLVWNKNISSLK